VAEPTVGAGFARGLLEFAVGKGADRETLLAESGLKAEDLLDQDARAPFASYVALMRAAKRLTGDPALPLHYGEQVDIASISIVGLIGLAAENMLDAFRQLNRYVRLIVEVDTDGEDRFKLETINGALWMIDTRRNPNDFPELTESAFSQLISGPRRLYPDDFVREVHFTHADPGYRDEHARIFGAPVIFDSHWNAARLSPALVEHKVARFPRYVFGALSEKADRLLADLERDKTVRAKVEGAILPVIHTGEVGMERVAAKLGLSRQTLFRKLKAEGTSFEKVLDELRQRLATDYLASRKVSVNETAYLVGFSDPAAFSRAFKRWTGMSPKDARTRVA
jgi:AraC-like DNA-binding protein